MEKTDKNNGTMTAGNIKQNRIETVTNEMDPKHSYQNTFACWDRFTFSQSASSLAHLPSKDSFATPQHSPPAQSMTTTIAAAAMVKKTAFAAA